MFSRPAGKPGSDSLEGTLGTTTLSPIFAGQNFFAVDTSI